MKQALLAAILVLCGAVSAEARPFGFWRWLGVGFGEGIHARNREGDFAQFHSAETVYPAGEPVPARPEAVSPLQHRVGGPSIQGENRWHSEIRLLPPVAREATPPSR